MVPDEKGQKERRVVLNKKGVGGIGRAAGRKSLDKDNASSANVSNQSNVTGGKGKSVQLASDMTAIQGEIF